MSLLLNVLRISFFFHVWLFLDYTLTYRRACSRLRKYEGCAVIDSLQSQWVSERVVPTHSIPRRVRLLCATHAACYYNYSNESRLQLFRANIAHTHFTTKYLKAMTFEILIILSCIHISKYILLHFKCTQRERQREREKKSNYQRLR